jgi:Ankyrin repeats (many copies)
MEAVANHLNGDDPLKPESVIHNPLLPIPEGFRESSISSLKESMNDIEYTAMNRIFGKVMDMTKQDDGGKYATIIRKHTTLMMEELGRDFDIEMVQEQRQLVEERRAEANRQLFNLANEKGQPNWNLQSFMETITNLLAQGADPNVGCVLTSVVHRYCRNKITEYEFVEIFHRMVQEYGADVNFQTERYGPWIVTMIDHLIQKYNENRRVLTDCFYVIIANFLKHKGDINIQNAKTGSTILSSVCHRIPYMWSSLARTKWSNNIVKFLLDCGADVETGYGYNGYKAIHVACNFFNTSLVQFLLEGHKVKNNNVPIDHIIQSEKYQTTTFHVINHFHERFIPIVKLLLQYDANINIQDGEGNTILHQVVSMGDHRSEQIVQFLLDDCHADYLTIKNIYGQTAWDIKMMHLNSKDNTSSMNKKQSRLIEHYVVMEQKRRQQIFSSILLFCSTKRLTRV